MKIVLGLLLIILMSASVTFAEQVQLTLVDLPMNEPVDFDFGMTFMDIQSVSLEFSGQGGHQCISFSSIGGGIHGVLPIPRGDFSGFKCYVFYRPPGRSLLGQPGCTIA